MFVTLSLVYIEKRDRERQRVEFVVISFFFVDWLLGIIGTSGVGQWASDRKNKG